MGLTSNDSVTSMVLCPQNIMLCSTTLGIIKVICSETCSTLAQIDAHARSITSLSLAPKSGYILSTSEDSIVRVWKIAKKSTIDIQLAFSEHIPNALLQGGAFLSPNGSIFAVSYYDSSELIFFSQ